MKKVLLIIMSALLVFGLAGCSASATEQSKSVEGTLEEIMTNVYSGTGIEFPKFMNTAVNAENSLYFLGIENASFVESLASEPMMSSIAHSVVLTRVEEGTDIEAFKTQIKENIDPRKWICVGVEPENVIVENIGNLVILILDDENGAAIFASFEALAK